MEKLQQISTPQALHHFCTAYKSNLPPCHLHLLPSLQWPHLYLQPFLSWAFPSQLYFRPPNWALLQSSYLSEYHRSQICGLRPVLEYLYYIDPQNNSFRSFVLHPLPVPTYHFHHLFCCSSPLFLHSPYLPPFKITSYSNLHSLFFFVEFHTSDFCNLICGFQ